MNIDGWRVVLVCGIVAALAACAPLPERRPLVSGFLGGTPEYDSLVRSRVEPDLWTWRAPGRSLGEFSQVLLTPVEVWPAPAGHIKYHDESKIREMADFFHAEVERIVGASYPIVERTGPGVLAVRSALTEVDPAVPLLNIDPVNRAGNTGAARARVEVELVDAGTGEKIGMVLASGEAERALSLSGLERWKQPKEILTRWATLLHDRLVEERDAR